MNTFSLSADNIISLRALSKGNWDGFWLQGGVFNFLTPIEESVYVVPSIVVSCSAIVQLGAVSFEQVDGSELLPLSLNTLPEIGSADSERLWKPPRIPVTAFPDDLDLNPFLKIDIAIEILFDDDANRLVFDGIIFEQSENQLLVASAQHMPESIVVTRRKNYIADFLKPRKRKPVPIN